MTTITAASDIEVRGARRPEWDSILTPEALQFVAALQREFGARREVLAPARKATARRRPAGVVQSVRLCALLLPQRARARRARHRPVFLSAEDGVAPRGADLERRLHPRAGGGRSSGRDDPGHGA